MADTETVGTVLIALIVVGLGITFVCGACYTCYKLCCGTAEEAHRLLPR